MTLLLLPMTWQVIFVKFILHIDSIDNFKIGTVFNGIIEYITQLVDVTLI